MDVDELDIKWINDIRTEAYRKANRKIKAEEGFCICKDEQQPQLVKVIKSFLMNGKEVIIYLYFCTHCKRFYGMPSEVFAESLNLASPHLANIFKIYGVPLAEERRALDNL